MSTTNDTSAPPFDRRGVALRLGLLLSVVGVGVLILGALSTQSLHPKTILYFLSREIPGLAAYQINLIITSFREYDPVGMMTSLGFLMIVGSAITLLIFEIGFHTVKHRSIRTAWRESSLYRVIFGEESERTDLYLYLYYCFSLDRFLVAALGLLGPFFIFGLLINGANLGIAASWPEPVQFVAFILLADFVGYWFHRVAHTTPALWELHKFHHAATSMNFITAHRNHPMEVTMQLPLRAIPMLILGPSVHEYILYVAIHHFVILLQHSNFNITFGPLERILVSPRFHLVHHSTKIEHCDKNFGVIFSFWDDIFRTRYLGKDAVPSYGVSSNYFNRNGIIHDLYQPMVKFMRSLLVKGRIS